MAARDQRTKAELLEVIAELDETVSVFRASNLAELMERVAELENERELRLELESDLLRAENELLEERTYRIALREEVDFLRELFRRQNPTEEVLDHG